MTHALSMLKLGRLRPPIRRVLALDAGSRCLKLLLAESGFGRLRILREEMVDLQAEGLVSTDELRTHLQELVAECGGPPVALVLPQHLSISQIIDLPLAPESEVEKLIQDETLKLGGVSESRIIYDFVRTETLAKNRQQFWVTLCQEGDIRERIERLGIEPEGLCEMTTTANALIAAYRVTCPLSARAILVHMGAQSTVVVVLLAGQGAFAASFQMGGDFFTRALARLRHCSEDTAESMKRECDLLNGPDATKDFVGVVDGWVAELTRQLNEWFEHTPGAPPDPTSFEWVASGGGFEQPGLLEYLRAQAGVNLQPWPRGGQPEVVFPAQRFEVAFGTALQALGYSAQPVSLLPNDYRRAWQRRLRRYRLEFGSLLLLVMCGLMLVIGTWHKVSLISRKERLRAKVEAGQQAVEENDRLTARLAIEYETLRPLFASQQNTLDTLKTMALLQQARSNRSFWYVLVADQQSYFSRPAVTTTNKPARTNQLGAVAERAPTVGSAAVTSLTNSPAKPGIIAELCVPEEADAARAVLSQVVNHLKQQSLFSKVDLLSDDLRRSGADPKVVIPDRHFVLALDFMATDFQQSVTFKKGGGPSAKGPPKRPARPSGSASDGAPILP